MPRVHVRMITFLVLTVALLVELRWGRPASAVALEEDSLFAKCAKKVETMFPLITVKVQDLALDQVKVKVVEQQYIVIIPLKAPRGEMRGIQWTQKDPNVAVDFIRYLTHGNIGAVNVWPFLHNPAEMYVGRGVSREVIKPCQKEQIQEAFGKCTQCEVAEFLNIKP